jgi:prepilin peptidase CpaA
MTSHLLINEISILAVAALLVAAAVEDVRRLIIPNRIPLGIIILYPAYVLSTGAPVDWVGGSTLAAGALAIGIALFAFRYAGGGDVKLFVAASLWAGPALFPSFLLVTSLVGAAMAAGMLAHRRLTRPASAPVPAAAQSAERPALREQFPAMATNAMAALAQRRLLGSAIFLVRAAFRRADAEMGAMRAGTEAPSARSAPQRELPYGVAIAAGGIQVVVNLLVGG